MEKIKCNSIIHLFIYYLHLRQIEGNQLFIYKEPISLIISPCLKMVNSPGKEYLVCQKFELFYYLDFLYIEKVFYLMVAPFKMVGEVDLDFGDNKTRRIDKT